MNLFDFFGANLWLMWTLALVIFLILEVTSGDFFFMCFAIGAVAGAIIAAVDVPLMPQIIVWIVVTVLSLAFVRPFMLRYMHKKEKHKATNADALIGSEALVKEDIPAGGNGYVAVDGDMWRAVSDDPETIPAGSKVRIINRKSIVVTVTRI